MKSSQYGKLGLQNDPPILWKGRTFSQISSILSAPSKGNRKGPSLFQANPIPLYRKEILKTGTHSKHMRDFEIPGGTIVNTASNSTCIGEKNTLDINISSTHTDHPCSTSSWSDSIRNVPSLSAEYNARRLVRSSGMIRPKYDSKTNREIYNVHAQQYLHQRNKTFEQNQFNNIRIGDANAIPGSNSSLNNVYASNTPQYCSDTSTNYVPIYYKPNNSKFAQQGAVESSARLVRLKYDTITDVGAKMKSAYGIETANALAYGVPENGYTLKDKIGYPNTCTPVFSNATVIKKYC